MGENDFVDSASTIGTFDVSAYGQRLGYEDVRNLINGHLFAARQGWDLTALVTIRPDRFPQWSRSAWTEWQGRLLDKMQRWLIRHGIPPAFMWVREAGAINGEHLHLLVHLNDYLRQAGPFADFLRETGGALPDDETGNLAVVVRGGLFGMQVATMQSGSLKYLLKSIDPTKTRRGQNVAVSLGIKPHRQPQHIIGRLHHLSHTIGPNARRDAGWVDMRDLQNLRAYLHP